jgi:dinuclear metal center YbgI/SA1388 family protein
MPPRTRAGNSDPSTAGDIVGWLEERAPRSWAAEWDNVGLQLGSRRRPVEVLSMALELTSPVADEALAAKADLLILHHPPIFQPLRSLAEDQPGVAPLLALAAADVAVYAAHTNLDAAPELGTNAALARALGLDEMRPIEPLNEPGPAKIVTFVPPDCLAAVRSALSEAGAGVIGDYAECSYELRGHGGFVPLPGADPYIGAVGDREEVEEVRLEMVCPRAKLRAAVEALIASHPYEEPAFDLYGLLAPSRGAAVARSGALPRDMQPAELRDWVAERLGRLCSESLSDQIRPAVRLVSAAARPLRTVAVCGGSGGKIVERIARAGVDAYVTGEIGHHDAHRAQELGLTVVEAGHWATEWPVVRLLAEALQAVFPAVDVRLSTICTDPWREREEESAGR